MERTFKFYLTSKSCRVTTTAPGTLALDLNPSDSRPTVFTFYVSPWTTLEVDTPAPRVLSAVVKTQSLPPTARVRTANFSQWGMFPQRNFLAAACEDLSLALAAVRNFLAYDELPLVRIDKEGTSYSLIVTTSGRLLGCRPGDVATVYWAAGTSQAVTCWEKIKTLIGEHLLNDRWSPQDIQAFQDAVARQP